MIGVIIVALLAVGFVVLLWVRSAGPSNEGESLGDNAPYPDTVLGPSVHRPRLGSPESLESHSDPEWLDEELQRSERRWHRSGP